MLSKRTSRAYVAHADTAPGFWMIGILWRMLATGVQTGSAMCLLDQSCPKGSGPARHMHRQDEGLYVASGSVTFNAGGDELVARVGTLVTVPRHTEHSFVVDDDAVLINFYFPAGFDLWLMGSAVPALRDELPPPNQPPPFLPLMKRLSDDYDGLPLTEERSTSLNPLAPAQPTARSRATAENIWFNDGRWSVLADAKSTGGSYTVFEVELPRDAIDRPHIHDHSDEACYLLDGELTFFVDDQVHELTKGSFIFVPRGSVHGFRVVSETARFLNIHTTPGYERLVRALGTAADAPVLPPPGWRESQLPDNQLSDLHADIGWRGVTVPADFVP